MPWYQRRTAGEKWYLLVIRLLFFADKNKTTKTQVIADERDSFVFSHNYQYSTNVDFIRHTRVRKVLRGCDSSCWFCASCRSSNCSCSCLKRNDAFWPSEWNSHAVFRIFIRSLWTNLVNSTLVKLLEWVNAYTIHSVVVYIFMLRVSVLYLKSTYIARTI